MRKSTIYLFVLGLAVVVMTAVASAGLVVSAQNSNSSTTMAPTMANTNSKAKSGTKRKPRRHTKRKAAADATTTGDTSMAAAPMTTKRTGRCDPMQHEQTDLSGTYTGKVNYPDASLTGDATLTITGNNFTLAAGSTTQSGRVTAVTTCGYTGVTMMFGDLTPPTPSPNPPAALPAVSLRAKKMGDRVTLMSVPGEKRMFSFGSGGTMGKAKPRKHRASRKAKTGTPPPPPAKMKM